MHAEHKQLFPRKITYQFTTVTGFKIDTEFEVLVYESTKKKIMRIKY